MSGLKLRAIEMTNKTFNVDIQNSNNFTLGTVLFTRYYKNDLPIYTSSITSFLFKTTKTYVG